MAAESSRQRATTFSSMGTRAMKRWLVDAASRAKRRANALGWRRGLPLPMRTIFASLVACSAVVATGVVRADTTSLVGADPETAAALGSDVADGASIGVLQVNPALLVDVEERAHVG